MDSPQLRLAIKLARGRERLQCTGSNSISRFVAILSDGNVAFIGKNSLKTHPLQLQYSPYPHTHAEIDCIRQACSHFSKTQGRKRSYHPSKNLLDGFKLSVARVLMDGTPALAKPCQYCTEAIRDFKISTLEYTNG